MDKEIIILIAEDDDGHALLIKKNLGHIGIINKILHFKDGEEILNFLFNKENEERITSGIPYILLLDIRMPKIDGTEVLKQIKSNEKLRKMPVIILTTTDDPREIDLCHKLGCNNYITKPVDYNKFVEVVNQLGLFLKIVQIPDIKEI